MQIGRPIRKERVRSGENELIPGDISEHRHGGYDIDGKIFWRSVGFSTLKYLNSSFSRVKSKIFMILFSCCLVLKVYIIEGEEL
jgi:hypothetical protein